MDESRAGKCESCDHRGEELSNFQVLKSVLNSFYVGSWSQTEAAEASIDEFMCTLRSSPGAETRAMVEDTLRLDRWNERTKET